jgi:hypothetical protein
VFCFLGLFWFAGWLCGLLQNVLVGSVVGGLVVVVGGQKLNIKESSKTQENHMWAGSSAGMNA